MEKRTEFLFYMGIEEKECPGNIRKSILPFEGGQLVVYGCFVPKLLVQPSTKRFRWQRSRQEKKRRKQLNSLLQEAVLAAQKELQEGRFHYYYPVKEIACSILEENSFLQLCDRDALEDRLYAIMLYRARKRNRQATFSVSLPKECGELTVMRLIALLQPYLARINAVVFIGEEDMGAGLLEEYLYDEYGIVMRYDNLPEPKTIWIDMQKKQEHFLLKYAKEREICHINSAEVLKFLDTAAKNRYNTKVN